MATYKAIQELIKKQHGFTVKTCWIAHVKEMQGYCMRESHNRKDSNRIYPCPPDKQAIIVRALEELDEK